LGASGDLVPLAHLAFFITEKRGVKLKPGEAIFLINGTHFSTSVLAFVVYDSRRLSWEADLIANKTMAALRAGTKLQEAYSLRCVPQVHGAVYQAITFAREAVNHGIEIISHNPRLSPGNDEIELNGDFHAQRIAMAADLLGIALTTLANISERRIERMLNPALSNGLPPFLSSNPGVDSGLMIAQYTAAALTVRNKVLAAPASINSVSVSAGQEDFVSMAATAALKAREILENTRKVLAIELLCAECALGVCDIDANIPLSVFIEKNAKKI